jgi:hypothetical protein
MLDVDDHLGDLRQVGHAGYALDDLRADVVDEQAIERLT